MSCVSVSAAHLLRLHERFEVLDRGQTGELRPQDFAALQGLALNPIGDRIIGAFFSAGVSEQETGNVSSSVLSPQTGSGGLSLLRPGPGSLPARRLEPRRDAGGAGQQPDREAPMSVEYLAPPPSDPSVSVPLRASLRVSSVRPVAFQMYDQDGDGKISREELLQVLRAMLGMQVTEEQLQSIGERAIRETDLDGDDAIGFDEFRKSVEKMNIDHMMSIRFLK
ncbi:calcineurin B homologous protein 2 isoform X2 [Scophthalmus maximus]|uniref:calcineurin B homologous protein 2 isoform X2 n=1 Tax=Scophthalmus maximus TaxID=52904 RepID=UPI001FA91230|nr:calcineurin B homologous protein 2 isoform X2 [Scophthalmus maximus]